MNGSSITEKSRKKNTRDKETRSTHCFDIIRSTLEHISIFISNWTLNSEHGTQNAAQWIQWEMIAVAGKEMIVLSHFTFVGAKQREAIKIKCGKIKSENILNEWVSKRERERLAGWSSVATVTVVLLLYLYVVVVFVLGTDRCACGQNE